MFSGLQSSLTADATVGVLSGLAVAGRALELTFIECIHLIVIRREMQVRHFDSVLTYLLSIPNGLSFIGPETITIACQFIGGFACVIDGRRGVDFRSRTQILGGAFLSVNIHDTSKCGDRHSVNNVLATGRDRQGWQDLIVKMASLGMSATDEELSDISDYLTASFPPAATKLNVNKASATQLVTSLALTADEAKEIVGYREKNGDFKSLDDLKKVPNVDAKKLDAKKDLLLFS